MSMWTAKRAQKLRSITANFREPYLSFQNPHGGLQLIHNFSYRQFESWVFCGDQTCIWCTYIGGGKTSMYINTNLIFLKFNKYIHCSWCGSLLWYCVQSLTSLWFWRFSLKTFNFAFLDEAHYFVVTIFLYTIQD